MPKEQQKEQPEERKALVLPVYPNVEENLISACLIANDVGPGIVCGSLTKGDFTDSRCAAIFEVMSAVYSRGDTFDAQILTMELHARGLGEVVTTKYIYKLLEGFVLDQEWTFDNHVKIIRQATVARNLILECRKVATGFGVIASDCDGWEGFAEKVRSDINGICDGNSNGELVDSKTAADIAYEEVVAAKGSVRNGLIGTTTGIPSLDRLTHGYQPGQLVVVAGKSSMGKSAFAAHSAYRAAKSGAEVAYFSLEMSTSSNMKRILANESKVSAEKMTSGYATQNDLEVIRKAADRVGEAPMWFTDRLSGFEEIVAAITRLKAKRPDLKAVFVDYLQLMSTSTRNLTRDREIGIQTGGLKRLASKLGIAIVLLSQVNRGTGDDRPSMDNLRESGNIEQDANVVLFVHRPDYFDKGKPQTTISKAELIVAKNREGQTGTVQVSFNKATSDFADLADED